MITAERKRWLIERLRHVAQESAPAREWPDVARSFDRLADDIERDRIPRDALPGATVPAPDEKTSP